MNLFLLIGMCRQFTFNAIIDMFEFRSTILLFVFFIVCLFFCIPFTAFYGPSEHFLNIPFFLITCYFDYLTMYNLFNYCSRDDRFHAYLFTLYLEPEFYFY